MENQQHGKIPDSSILVTMHVCSLYTNIANKEGNEAVETNIANKEGNEAVETSLKRKNKGTRIISTLLHLVLTLNNFVFNSQSYLQIKGCTMNTKYATSYGNIFMVMFEQ